VRSTAAPYTESRLTHLVRNKCVGFPVVEHHYRLDLIRVNIMLVYHNFGIILCTSKYIILYIRTDKK
jgi:hypothetical protein